MPREVPELQALEEAMSSTCLRLTRILPRRNDKFEMEGWDELGTVVLVLQDFVAMPCEFDPEKTTLAFMGRDIFVKEPVDQIFEALKFHREGEFLGQAK